MRLETKVQAYDRAGNLREGKAFTVIYDTATRLVELVPPVSLRAAVMRINDLELALDEVDHTGRGEGT